MERIIAEAERQQKMINDALMVKQAEEAAQKEKVKYKDVKTQLVTKPRMLAELKRNRSSSNSSYIDDDDLQDLDPLMEIIQNDMIRKNNFASDKIKQLARKEGKNIREFVEVHSG